MRSRPVGGGECVQVSGLHGITGLSQWGLTHVERVVIAAWWDGISPGEAAICRS